MLDIEKQINHWCAGAAEDWDVARSLVSQGKLRHGLFCSPVFGKGSESSCVPNSP